MASIAGAAGPKKIVLKGAETQRAEEGVASGSVTPGMNVNMTTAAETAGRHTYAAGATPVGATGAGAATPRIIVAKEVRLYGKTIDDAIPSGDNLLLHVCRPGDIIQVLVASGQTIVKGNGGAAVASGKWNVATVNTVGEFLEGSGGALGADTHMRLRVF